MTYLAVCIVKLQEYGASLEYGNIDLQVFSFLSSAKILLSCLKPVDFQCKQHIWTSVALHCYSTWHFFASIYKL